MIFPLTIGGQVLQNRYGAESKSTGPPSVGFEYRHWSMRGDRKSAHQNLFGHDTERKAPLSVPTRMIATAYESQNRGHRDIRLGDVGSPIDRNPLLHVLSGDQHKSNQSR